LHNAIRLTAPISAGLKLKEIVRTDFAMRTPRQRPKQRPSSGRRRQRGGRNATEGNYYKIFSI